MIKFLLTGQLPSGKNQQQLAMVRGRIMKFPNKRFKEWRAAATQQLIMQAPLPFRTFTKPLEIRVNYWAGDLIKRDATGLLDALFHLFELAPTELSPVVKDDCLFHGVVWTYCGLDRANPRAEIEITEVA